MAQKQNDQWDLDEEESLGSEKHTERFVKVPLAWAAQVAKALREPSFVVVFELMRAIGTREAGPSCSPTSGSRN